MAKLAVYAGGKTFAVPKSRPVPRGRPTSWEDQPLGLTIPEAAVILTISRGTAYDWANRGLIPCVRIGLKRLVPRDLLRDFMEGRWTPESRDVR